MENNKKKIKIKFVDFWDSFNYENFYIYKILNTKYDVEISDNPDYIFYSNSGYSHLEYDCIRISYTIENIRPNFNHCDYAIGFDYINFEDRYIRVPIYLCFDNYLKIFDIAQNKHINEDNYTVKNKFCNMVCSNGLNIDRINFYKKLNQYKKTDSGGKLLNNVGGPVPDKLLFQKEYKFSLSFENSSSNGYTTEKIVDAFASGGIPIYWGDPLVTEVFNKKAFINYKDFRTEEELIDYIKKVDSNDELYLSYIKEPMLKDSCYLEKEREKISSFVFNIFDSNIIDSKRRCDSHFVIQEKKGLIIVDKIIKTVKPLLNIKSKIKNKLIK